MACMISEDTGTMYTHTDTGMVPRSILVHSHALGVYTFTYIRVSYTKEGAWFRTTKTLEELSWFALNVLATVKRFP